MKNSKLASRLLCLLLALILCLSLAACPMGEPAPGTTGNGGSTGSSGSTTGGKPQRPAPKNETERLSYTSYADAEDVEYAGVSFAEDAFVLTGRKPSETVIEITAQELSRKITRSGLEKGATYRVTDAAPVTLDGTNDKNFDLGGTVILSDGGILFKDCIAVSLQNVTLISSAAGIVLEASADVTLEGAEVVGAAACVSADENTSRLTLKGVRLVGDKAVVSASEDLYVLDSYLSGKTLGLADSAKQIGVYLRRTRIDTEGTALQISSVGAEIRNSTLNGTAESVGVAAVEGARELLVAQCDFNGLQLSCNLQKAVNVAVVLNSVTNILSENGESIYLTDNRVSGEISLHGNNYLLADRNQTVSADRILQTNNENTNGDTITDVDARLEVGADPNLLPHINKELHVGTPRAQYVRTDDREATLTLERAITATEWEGGIIIAPGAYRTKITMSFARVHNNLSVYAYGVLAEKEGYGSVTVSISGAENISLYGITFDHTENSMGQAVVLKKDQSTKEITLLAGAGMLPNWTDKDYYNWQDRYGAFYGYRAGHPEPYADMGCTSCKFNADGTMTIKMNTSSNYERIAVGDTICIRGLGSGSVSITDSKGILLQDFTLLGGAGFGLHETSCNGQNTYYRAAITPGYPAIIDEETYFRYQEAEDTYGVDFGIYIDEQGRYRGTTPKVSTVDATHNANNIEGTRVVSCLFESMCDDGTNQKSVFGFLNGYTLNSDGTVTLKISTGIGRPFQKGNTIHIYNKDGGLFCDTTVVATLGLQNGAYMIKVAEKACDFTVLQGYNLHASTKEDPGAILAVNASYASDGFYFDNTVVQNIRSRGLLLKASNGTVKNCSLINIGMAAVAIHYEISWGEAGISRGLTIENNLIRNTGFFNSENRIYSAISVDGLNKKTMDEKYMTYRDITIKGNRVEERVGMYALQLTGAMNVKVENNYFGGRTGETADGFRKPVLIYYAKNISFDGNTFPTWCDSPDVKLEIKGGGEGLTGADLEGYYG